MGLSLLSQPAQAINLTFSFDGSDNGLTTISKTVSGVTINLSNLNRTNAAGAFNVDSDGIGLSSVAGNQFDISFSQAVQFISYNVTYESISNGQTASFVLSNPNGNASTGNNLANLGTFDFTNQFNLNAGQTSTLTAILSSPSTDFTQIQAITVDATAVPWETDALSVIGSTILFGAGLWTKNKFAKPLQK